MAVLVPIGEFSKMTYLSVKALRHYHDLGLLEPAAVEPDSGYRLYSAEQVPVAQAIRRFRDLDMPLDHISQVLAAPDEGARNEAILAHLAKMQEQLERTQLTVASLQALLSASSAVAEVERRTLPRLSVFAITEVVDFDACGEWIEAAFAELHAALDDAGVVTSGSDGDLYTEPFFLEGAGEVTAFVPMDGAETLLRRGRMARIDLPAGEFAVLQHEGSFDELDQTYGKLGTWVSERGIGLPGAIREHYPTDDRPEVCWPVTAR
jgi:DNA-binding transcriptional MerR regulator